MSLCLWCSRIPFSQILEALSTPTCTETIDNPSLSVNWQIIKPVLSLGVLAELWLTFPEFKVHHSSQVFVMFALDKIWCHWHCRVNTTQKQYAICSTLAASAFPALVISKGHHIEEIPEFPLVVEDKVDDYKKTKDIVLLLKKLKA
uniref:Uncharacterized protein n=1 Tax=Pipistrellus kuhlii TaxID=59472 RepID=A0A7J8B1M1_PIPKU|nr:hypothetical protein mPipKuh1_007851 [Pipistrellus kuhlii]